MLIKGQLGILGLISEYFLLKSRRLIKCLCQSQLLHRQADSQSSQSSVFLEVERLVSKTYTHKQEITGNCVYLNAGLTILLTWWLFFTYHFTYHRLLKVLKKRVIFKFTPFWNLLLISLHSNRNFHQGCPDFVMPLYSMCVLSRNVFVHKYICMCVVEYVCLWEAPYLN